MLANFSTERHETALQYGQELVCLIHSNHALAVGLIKDALSSDPSIHPKTEPFSSQKKQSDNGKVQILILDTCSVQNWIECLEKWHSEGGISIGLVSSDPLNNDLEL